MNTCIKCGCEDAYPSLPPCPVPVDCPNPQPCAEFFDAQCVVYTLPDIMCGLNIVVAQDSSIAEALESIVLFFCTNLSSGVLSVTDDGAGGVAVNNTDPFNPVVSFIGVFVDGTLSGDGTFGSPLSVISSGGVTGSGTVNYLARWTPTGTQLGIGLVQDDNSTTSINGSLNTNYQFIVYNSTRSNTIAGENSQVGSSEQVGILGTSNGAGTGKNIGVYGSTNSNSILNVGVYGLASGVSTTNIGGKFSSSGATNNYSLQLQDGTEGINRVLTDVTGNGDAHWVTPSSGGGLTWSTIIGASPVVTLAANNGYVIRDTTGAFTTLTLPSSGVVVGDIIKIIATTEGGGGSITSWQILKAGVSDVIFYSFYESVTFTDNTGVLGTSPLLTFDDTTTVGSSILYKNQSLTLTCVQDLVTGYAWNIELANGKLIG
jgi:hypothetical protein